MKARLDAGEGTTWLMAAALAVMAGGWLNVVLRHQRRKCIAKHERIIGVRYRRQAIQCGDGDSDVGQ